MATSPPTGQPNETPRQRIFGGARRIALLVLLAMLAACLIFSWSTRQSMEQLLFQRRSSTPASATDSQKSQVSLRPWETATALASMAVTGEESEFAQEAERLADHEVDQAFASALRQATAQVQNRVLTGDALELTKRMADLEDLVKQDKDDIKGLTPPPGSTDTDNEDELEIAKAQLQLDSDQLDDAQQDLARASGDDRAEIQSELQAHEAAMKKFESEGGGTKQIAALSTSQYNTLAARVRAWRNQRTRHELIEQARLESESNVAALQREHDALQKQLTASAMTSTGGSLDHAGQLASIRTKSAQRQLLTLYDNRIETERQLAAVYGKWLAQVMLQHRIVLHMILGSLVWILVIVIGILLADRLVTRLTDGHGIELFGHGKQADRAGQANLASQANQANLANQAKQIDRRQLLTLRTILQLAVQTAGVLLVLLVIFGWPKQMPTILGLTTAGLTVVLQDFIIAFFGWFVLMGRHGIRVGDWVEINGVAGEVAEVGLFRTKLLETGNWTDKGHPTGRRVAFINSYAIRGQFFNFSTAGQWMWDEIAMSMPATDDTYVTVESIHKAVLEETAKDARAAEAEWKRDGRQDGLSQFSADASVSLRPSAAGIDILVRYVTRASERTEMRSRLFQRVMDVLHKPNGAGSATAYSEVHEGN